MIEATFTTYSDLAMLVLRVITGIIFIVHGYAKLFAPGGQQNTATYFRQAGIPAPAVAALLAGIIEFFGGVALFFGIATRLAALLIAIVLLVTLLLAKLKVGFTRSDTTGYEFELAMLAISLILLTQGAGPTSLDAKLGLHL